MTIYLDAGHGGIKNGKYTTKGKQFDHGKGSFHQGTVFLEGVFNRDIARLAKEKLSTIEGLRIVPVYHDNEDWSLNLRVEKANKDYLNTHDKKAIYISIHSNAANTTARGWSVWTSKGNTKSDVIADKLHEITKDLMPDIKMRQDTSDGDKDYEDNFQVLKSTKMPAILIEFLFFDNYEDACLLMDKDVQERFATTIALLAKWYQEN